MDSKVEQAREWAAEIAESRQTNIRPGAFAAAEIIQSLPDQWVGADKVREIIEEMKNLPATTGVASEIAIATEAWKRRLEALVPPKLPTLADMTPEERGACQWMQAMFTKSGHEHVITCIFGNKSRLMRRDDGMGFEVPNDEIIPLPELPKLEWPATHADTITTESVEDVQAGRVADFEPALPRPEDVPAGEPWIVENPHYDGQWVGIRNQGYAGPIWSLVNMEDTRARWGHDHEITLISRLVSEHKENA